MRSRRLVWVVALQLAAGLGVTAPHNAKEQPGLLRSVCLHAQEPSATALRLMVEQAELPQRFPGVSWPLVLQFLVVPGNIVVWAALLHTLLGDDDMDSEEVLRASSVARRAEDLPPPAEGPPPTWTFPTSFSDPRR